MIRKIGVVDKKIFEKIEELKQREVYTKGWDIPEIGDSFFFDPRHYNWCWVRSRPSDFDSFVDFKYVKEFEEFLKAEYPEMLL